MIFTDVLFGNILQTTWQQVVMWCIGGLLIYLAIAKEMEPSLLLPMGFGAILVNLPFSGAITQGAEQGPLLTNPKLMFFGAFAQFGIFFTLCLARLIGFDLRDAASIAIIGAADGPTSIFVAEYFKSNYIGAIVVAAYSYMALVPIVQPPVIRAVTTKQERMIRMEYNQRSIPKYVRIIFPIAVTVIAGLVAPRSVALVGFLMFGNLLRECGVLNSLSDTAQNVLANLITILLGLVVANGMVADKFLAPETLIILALGLVAFVMDTVGGVMFAKLINLFSKKKVNPMIGACGISAFPMSSRVIHKMAIAEDPYNFLLMHAAGTNVAGQIASVIAGGLVIKLVENLL